jgi:transposase
MASKRKAKRLRIVHPDTAGIDVGKRKHYVAVDPARCEQSVRNFGSFTSDLEELADWLDECCVKIVAMESTGVYWIPLYEVLDRRGFEVHLVNPRATKHVSGRKSDVLDCEWIWQLMSYGLLRGAFRPPDTICELRSYVRQRSRLHNDTARSIQHMQKALTEMNVKPDSVLSDITGQTGLAILRAIVAGERDGTRLAKYRNYRVKADEATIARALQGNWRDEHLLALEQAIARFDFFRAQIGAVEQRIRAVLVSLRIDETGNVEVDQQCHRGDVALQEALREMMGVDLTAIPTIGVETALVIASEIGPDLNRFPTREHFCSWLTLAPGTRISGDRKLSGTSPKRVNRAGQALRMAAASARNNKSYIGAAHRARLSHLDAARANKATAHQLARLIYAMLTRGEEYVDRGIESFEQHRREREIKNLQQRARRMGMTLTEDAA